MRRVDLLRAGFLGALVLLMVACGSGEGGGAEDPAADVAVAPTPDSGPSADDSGPVAAACAGVSVRFEPAAPRTSDPVAAIVEGAGGAFEITWLLVGAAGDVFVAEGTPLSAVKTAKGAELRAVATALGPTGCQEVSATVVIANTPPTLAQVTVIPSATYAGQPLTCHVDAAQWSDPDPGDPQEPLFEWVVSGVVAPGALSDTLDNGYQKGDDVVCRVTPFDGEDAGEPVDSAPTPVLNAPPEVAVSLVCPEPGAPMVCTAAGTDPDGLEVSLEFDWVLGPDDCSSDDPLQDGEAGPASVTSSTLTTPVTKGSQVQCCVTVRDEDGLAAPVAASEPCIVADQPPVASGAVVQSADGASLVATSTAVCDAEVYDPDGEAVQTTCTWFVNGSALPGTVCELSGAFAKGDTLCCQVLADDGSSTTIAEAKICPKVADTPPVVSDVAISPEEGAHCEPLACSGQTADADGDEVTLTFAWSVDGVGVAGIPSAKPGQEVSCLATPVADGLSGESGSSSLTITNAPPSGTGAAVTADPAPATAKSVVTCVPEGWEDTDACDTEGWTFEWYVNAEKLEGESKAVLSAGNYTKQSLILCVAFPSDGWEQGAPQQSGVLVIENTAPEVSSVSVSPIVGKDSTEFTCVVDGEDPDDDPITWVFTWFVDGAAVPSLTGPTVTGVPFSGVQAELSCTAQPFDAQTSGAAMPSSNTAVLFNVPPMASGVKLTPLKPDTQDDLTCAANISDADGDDVTPKVEWFQVLAQGAVLLDEVPTSTMTLPSSATQHFDQLYCRVTPHDGKVAGAPQISNSVVVANSVPSITSVVVTPSPGTPQTALTCSVLGYFDADGDEPQLGFEWTLAGDTVPGATEGTWVPASGGATAGQAAGCTATPFDGFESGEPLTSAAVTLVDCQVGADGLLCDDGEPCTQDDSCFGGSCLGVLAACDDKNPCTTDGCVPGVGCNNTSVAEGVACDDGQLCTILDACTGGNCKGGALLGCDDDNPCTADTCVHPLGCKHVPQEGACDDGVCVEGVCCIPDCTQKVCGGDGCGGSCGTCDASDVCLDPPGQCFSDLTDAMVVVPPGAFEMGCNEPLDTSCKNDEKPLHTVTLSPYRIDVAEVTVGHYGECVDAGACPPANSELGACLFGKPGVEELPINCVEWTSAASYCAWAGKRLCTEAEWEKAARGTEGQIYPWGNLLASCALAIIKEGGNFGCGLGGPAEVGSVLDALSPYGMLDAAGNVSEWVADYYSSAFYVASPAKDPKGPAVATFKVHRGGGYETPAAGVRASSRNILQPDNYAVDVGFRCCADLEP